MEKPFTETAKFTRWRTSMGYLYMAVCAFDFIAFPILYSTLQFYLGVTDLKQWDPITLHGAGLFHLAMGAILGISAFTKSQEVITERKFGYTEKTNSNKYKRKKEQENKERDELL